MSSVSRSPSPAAKRSKVETKTEITTIMATEEVEIVETITETKMEETVEVTPVSTDSEQSSVPQSKCLVKELEWRTKNLPEFQKTEAAMELSEFSQQQSTQQALRYKNTKFDPVEEATWQPGEPYALFFVHLRIS